MSLPTCADCGGFDIEWMYHCEKHGTDRCRGCSCPWCDEELIDDEDEDWDPYEAIGESRFGLPGSSSVGCALRIIHEDSRNEVDQVQ